MTPGTILLAIIGVWGAAAWLVGEWTFRKTERRWAKWSAMLFIWWLPLWDIAPGLYYYYKAIREIGGVHIYRTVEASGYLNGLCRSESCEFLWKYLRDSPYQYIEGQIADRHPLPATLTPEAGYYEFRLLERGSPECAHFESLANVDTLRSLYGINDRCVVAIHRYEPMSRYEYSRGESCYEAPSFLPCVRVSSTRIHDRQTGEIIAEANQIFYDSWLAGIIAVPVWQHINEDGRSISLRLTDVIAPVGDSR